MNTPEIIWERYRNETEPERNIKSGHCLLPEVPSLGWCKSHNAAFGGKRTYGAPAFELGYIAKGSVEWWLDGELQEIGPGSIFISKPGEHQGGDYTLIHPCERYWIRIQFPNQGALPGLSRALTEDLNMTFNQMRYRHFPTSPEVKHCFEQLLHEHRNPQALSLLKARATLHQLIVATVRDYKAKERACYPAEISGALSWIHSHNLRNCHIKDIAEVVGLSVGYFHERFMGTVGYTPNDYLNRRRIYLAKLELIRSAKTVTEVAFEVGFSSSQYFATVFKKLVGITPVAYRKLYAERQLVA